MCFGISEEFSLTSYSTKLLPLRIATFAKLCWCLHLRRYDEQLI